MTEAIVSEVGKPYQVWKLVFSADELRADPSDGRPSVHVQRSDAEKTLSIFETLPAPILILKRPRRVALQLDETALRSVIEWLGNSLHLRIALRNRIMWTIPIGLLFLITSVPLPGDPEAGVEAVPFNAFSAVMGAALIAQGVLSRVFPHRVYLLLNAIWFAALAGDTVRSVITGWSPLWLVVVALQIFLAFTGVRQYRRFTRG